VRPGPASPEGAWVAWSRNSALGAGVGLAGRLVQRISGCRSAHVPRPGKKRPTAEEPGAASGRSSAPMSVLPVVVPIVTACRRRKPALGWSFLAPAFAQHPWAQHCLAADARLRFASMIRKYTTSILHRAPRRAPLKAPLCAQGQRLRNVRGLPGRETRRSTQVSVGRVSSSSQSVAVPQGVFRHPGKRRSTPGELGAASGRSSAPMSLFSPVVPIVKACRGRRSAFGSSFLARAFAHHCWAQHCLAADARLRFARMTRKYTPSNLHRAPRRTPLKAPLCASVKASGRRNVLS
jgi:hypothetical protein